MQYTLLGQGFWKADCKRGFFTGSIWENGIPVPVEKAYHKGETGEKVPAGAFTGGNSE